MGNNSFNTLPVLTHARTHTRTHAHTHTHTEYEFLLEKVLKSRGQVTEGGFENKLTAIPM